MVLLRSFTAVALDLGRASSVVSFNGNSSDVGVLSCVGEAAGDELRDVTNVRWPEDI